MKCTLILVFFGLCCNIGAVCKVIMIQKDLHGQELARVERSFENELEIIALYSHGELEELIRMFYPDIDIPNIKMLDLKFEPIPGGKRARKELLVMSFSLTLTCSPCLLSGASKHMFFTKEDIRLMAKDVCYKRKKLELAFPGVDIPEDYSAVMVYGKELIDYANVDEILSRIEDGKVTEIYFPRSLKNIKMSFDSHKTRDEDKYQKLEIGIVSFVYKTEHLIQGSLHHTEFQWPKDGFIEGKIEYHGETVEPLRIVVLVEPNIRGQGFMACHYRYVERIRYNNAIKFTPPVLRFLAKNSDNIAHEEMLLFVAYSLGAEPVYTDEQRFQRQDIAREDLATVFRELTLEKTDETQFAELEQELSYFRK